MKGMDVCESEGMGRGVGCMAAYRELVHVGVHEGGAGG
jgi:hypothetical protein